MTKAFKQENETEAPLHRHGEGMKNTNARTAMAALLKLAILPMVALAMLGATPSGDSMAREKQAEHGAREATRWLGAMSPTKALEYMKTTENLVVIDVREPQYINQSFDGAMQIPWTKMAERCGEIPSGRPVLLHCGLGMVVPDAYNTLRKKRNDLESVAYINGAPLFSQYNKWKKSRR